MENIDTLIISRLGEHQRKCDFIHRNLNCRKDHRISFRKVSYTLLAAAACVAIILTLSPILTTSDSISDISVAPPSFSEFRGAEPNNIESLISKGQYETALAEVNYRLSDIDKEIMSLHNISMDDEERDYISALYNGEKEELLWSKIYLLLKMNRKDDLKMSCRNYLENKEFGEHKSEVDMILKKIQ